MKNIICESYVICSCGAYTIHLGESNHSFHPDNVDEFEIHGERLNDYGNCNHCVNKWGIDLCSCGSGETPDECDNKIEMCGTPMQIEGVPYDFFASIKF